MPGAEAERGTRDRVIDSLIAIVAAGLLLPAAGAAAIDTDVDGDGVDNAADNCLNVANPAQVDSDGDLFGNACDTDINNDGITNVIDLGELKLRFFSADPDADFNVDGIVNVIDLGTLKQNFFLAPGPSGAAASAVNLVLTPAFSGQRLSSPIAMRQAPDDATRWYVLERGGKIVGFDSDGVPSGSVAVLNISSSVDSEFEGGALGFDFHPDFASNGYVYVSYTVDGPNFQTPLISRISRFETTIDAAGFAIADPASEVIILAVDQPFANHNGGNLLFGPDGYLYWGLGDGGSGGDPQDNGQNTATLLATMVRIDIDVSQADFDAGIRYYNPPGNPFSTNTSCTGGCPEIFAWGLRNPWRFSFDRDTGELWAGDVGQFSLEEIDVVEAGKNYGWRCREGNAPFSTGGCLPLSAFEPPVYDYGRGDGNSITGGYVYRGSQIPNFAGMYLYADYGSGRLWGLYQGAYAGLFLNTGLSIVSFGEGQNGELYVVAFGVVNGGIFRIDEAP